MSTTTDNPAAARVTSPPFPGVAVAAAMLLLLAGFQTLRAFLPSVIWYLGDSLSVPLLVLTALAVFASGLLVPLLRRFTSALTLFSLAGFVLIGARVVLQFSGSAPIDLVASSLGVASLMVILTTLVNGLPLQKADNGSDSRGRVSLVALSLGLALLADTAIRIGLGNYDLVWHRDPGSTVIVVVVALAALTLVTHNWTSVHKILPALNEAKVPGARSSLIAESAPTSAYGAASIGLTLMAVLTAAANQQAIGVAANPASAAIEGSAIEIPWLSGLVAVLGPAVGLGLGLWGTTRGRRPARWFSIVSGGVAILMSGALLAGFSLWGAALPVLGASLVCAIILALRPVPRTNSLHATWPRSVAVFLGFVGYLALSLAALYDVTEAVPVAGLVAGVCAIVAALRLGEVPVGLASGSGPNALRDEAGRFGLTGRVVVASITLVAVAVTCVGAIAYAPPSLPPARDHSSSTTTHTSSEPAQITVMTLNLHQGLDANTHVNLGGLVDLVRTQDPDILAVQEVNRGRANNGYNDVLAVLAAELDLPFLYGTNSPDGLYGNALLSRLPVTDWEYHHFDASSGERRGMLEATLSVAGTAEGPSTDLTVLVTHLDHVSGDDNVRGAQLDELNAIWDGRAPAILLGDFNTTPESPELAALGERGWTDALAQYGDPTATTFWGAPGGSEPESRLDYVFVTPGITVERVASVDSKASDHKPIVARVSVR